MNKKNIIGIVAVLAIVSSIGLVSAFGGMGRAEMAEGFEPGEFHEQMEVILEEGTFEDLEALRENTGIPIKPWVDTEEEFVQWQEQHADMEAYWEEQGIEPGQRGMGKLGQSRGSGMGKGMHGQGKAFGGFNGDCPMAE